MIVLAMDIASRTGIAVGGLNEQPACWSVDLGRYQSLDKRLAKLLSLTDRLIREYKPDLIAAEDKIGGKKVNAPLIQMFGCVRGCTAARGVRFQAYALQSVRVHFIGKNLTKQDFPHLSEKDARAAIKLTVINRCRVLGWGDLDEDASDAGAVWDYACAKEGAQSKPLGGLFV